MPSRLCFRCGRELKPTDGYVLHMEWRKPFQERNGTQVNVCSECIGGLEEWMGRKVVSRNYRSCTAPVCPYIQNGEQMSCGICPYASGRFQDGCE